MYTQSIESARNNFSGDSTRAIELYEQTREILDSLKMQGWFSDSSSESSWSSFMTDTSTSTFTTDEISAKTLEAKECLAKAIQLDPKYPGFHVLMGEIEFLLGNTDAACAALSEAIRLNPSFSDAYYQPGDAYMLRATYAFYGRIISPEMMQDLEAARNLGHPFAVEWVKSANELRLGMNRYLEKEILNGNYNSDGSSFYSLKAVST